MRLPYNNLSESYYYQIFNESAMSADTPLNDASPIQQQMIQNKIAEMPTGLADRVKDFLRSNWKWLTVGAAMVALYGITNYSIRNSDSILAWLDKDEPVPLHKEKLESLKKDLAILITSPNFKNDLTGPDKVKSLFDRYGVDFNDYHKKLDPALLMRLNIIPKQ